MNLHLEVNCQHAIRITRSVVHLKGNRPYRVRYEWKRGGGRKERKQFFTQFLVPIVKKKSTFEDCENKASSSSANVALRPQRPQGLFGTIRDY